MALAEPHRSSPANQALLFPFAAVDGGAVAPTTFTQVSSTVVGVPRVLVSYYDQQVTGHLICEMANAEAAFAVVTPAPQVQPVNASDPQPGVAVPIGGQYLGICNGAPHRLHRVAGPLVDLSLFFRTGQAQFFTVFGRRLDTTDYGIVRHCTLVLYLGSITIGRQEQRSG